MGWNIYSAEAIDEGLRQHRCKILHGSTYIGGSLDESEGCMYVHAYIVNSQFEREHIFIGLPRIEGKLDASNLCQTFLNTLVTSGRPDSATLAQKLVCIAADGAAVLQGEQIA